MATGIIRPTVAGSSASPNLGNGGTDYNTAEAELKKKIAQNQLNIATNKGHVESETARALKVIQERQAAGLDTSAQQKYLTTNLGYKAPTTNTNTTSTLPTASPVASKTNASQGSALMEQMFAIANREKAEFSYDPNSDPSYQAALKRAQANIDTGNSAAQAEMNRRGILNSTITSDRMGEIASNEMGRVETEVIPQLTQQAYQIYLDRMNQEQQQFANMGSLAQMFTSEDQRGIDNTNTKAGLTGYLPGGEEAQGLVNQLMSLKQQAEAQGITAVERTKLSNQADGIRAMLSQMGVDASAYGANVNYNTASQVTPNIRTLAGQQLDASNQAQSFDQGMTTRKQNFAEGQQGWENNFANEQQAYRVGRDSVDDTYRNAQQKLSEKVQLGGLALDQANHLLRQAESLGYVTSELAAATGMPVGQVFASQANQANNVANDNFAQLMDIWKATGVAPAGINGVDQGTRYGGAESVKAQTAEGYATSYLDKAAQYDTYTGELLNMDPMEDAILESGLPWEEKKKLYVRYGIPLPSGE